LTTTSLNIHNTLATREGSYMRLSSNVVHVSLIAVLWMLTACLVNPLGDFPAIDDGAYAESVRSLTQNGELRFSNSTAMNLLSHILWGALFVKLFGMSFRYCEYRLWLLA
jgi:hypothetical protein